MGTPFEKTGLLRQHLLDRTVWYGIYIDDEKIGTAKLSSREVGDEIIINRESAVNVAKEGVEEPEKLTEHVECLCNADYSLKSLQYSVGTSDREETAIKGRVEDDHILLFADHKGKKYVRKVPTSGKAFYLPVTLIPLIHQQKPAPHDVFRIPVLDIINMRLVDSRITLEEIIPVKAGINIRSIYRYTIDGSTIWANETGSVIKEKRPSGIQLYAQPESIALEPGERLIFDYTDLPYFKANKVIADPELISLMTVRIGGVPPGTLKSENFVKPLSDKVFVIHKIASEDLEKASYTLPSTEGSAAQYLEPDKWVASDYGPLKKTGRIYAAANKNDAFELTSYLTSYVHNLIRTNPQFPLRDSATILDYRVGDYIEKTLLFASYARAGGLPTRLMGGLVYRNGYFFFHTWPEVWFGKWVPVDPALYQFPADATHIPLVTGSLTDLISIIDELKSIHLEILEVS